MPGFHEESWNYSLWFHDVDGLIKMHGGKGSLLTTSEVLMMNTTTQPMSLI